MVLQWRVVYEIWHPSHLYCLPTILCYTESRLGEPLDIDRSF